MARMIASAADGRVVPWFSEEDPVPPGFVVVPPALHAKYAAGEIADGKSLAKAALAAGSELGVPAANTSVEPPPPAPKRSKAAAGEKVEPGFPSVAKIPDGVTMRA